MSTPYTPSDEDIEVSYALGRVEYSPGSDITLSGAHDEFRVWLARVKRDAAREALDGLSAWLGDLAEKHPARSAHIPLMQGHITRYITDNYPEEDSR